MNQQISGIPGQRLWRAVFVLVTSVGLTMVPLCASAQSPSGTGACIRTATDPLSGPPYDECTASDLALGTFLAVVDDGCTGPSDTFTAIITAEVSSTARGRYDIGLWANILGDSALAPELANDQCFREILHPVTNVPGNIDLTGGSGPFWDLDEDACGDLEQDELNRIVLNDGLPITMPCRDVDGDGLADFSACASYEQNKNVACAGYLDALPGATSKCRCQTIQLANIPVPQLTIEKVCAPSVVPAGGPVTCTITYANIGLGDAEGYELVDDYDEGNGAASAIQPTNPGDNSGEDDGDVIAWELPPIPAITGTGVVSYTYTVDGSVEAGTEIRNVATIYYDQDPVVDDDAIVTVQEEGELAIQVTKTALPTSLPEPGGLVDFTVRVDNLSSGPIDLVTLIDDIHSDLDGKGDCSLPQSDIPSGGFYECTFGATVAGPAGYSETDTVVATATDGKEEVQAQDDATVTIRELAGLAIDVTKTADPSSLFEPGGEVDFTVRVENLSIVPLDLVSLIDDIHGDLNGQGSCSLPQTDIPNGGHYECAFSADVAGVAGYSETDTVTATATDGRREVQDQDDATVTIIVEPPDTGVALPVPLVAGALALPGIALLAGGILMRRRVRR